MPRELGDDYSVGEFEIDVLPVKNVEGVKLSFKVLLSCDSIRTLVDSKKAMIICHIECPQSAYRKTEEITSKEQTVVIPSGLLSGNVIVSPFIVTAVDVLGYTSPGFNSDYQNLSFDFDCGAVIAVGTQKRFFVEPSQKDLEYKPDIFSVIPYDDENGEVHVDTTGNKICIKLPRNVFSIYSVLLKSGANNEILWSAIVLPAIMTALYQMHDKAEKDELGELESTTWFQTISSKIRQLYSIEQIDDFLKEMDVVRVAQQLLSAPIPTALQKLTGLKRERQDED